MKIEIRPNRNQIILSDPTVIGHEGKFHMYVWTYLGIQEYVSADLNTWDLTSTILSNTLNFEKESVVLAKEGLGIVSLLRNSLKFKKSNKGNLNAYIRPYIFKDSDQYHLLFQNVKFEWDNKVIGAPITEIQIMSSSDLTNWSTPRTLLRSTEQFPTVSAPCLYKEGEKYRLLFTYDMEYTGNTSFAEPKYFAYADFNDLNGNPTNITKVNVIDGNGQSVNQVGYVRVRSGVFTCNPISKVGEVTDSSACFAHFDSIKNELQVLTPVLSEQEEESFSDSYVCDIAGKKIFVNAREKNKLTDSHDSSIESKTSKVLLVLKSIYLNREVICSKDI